MTPPPILRIVLTGFMGAGKSTIGALLAAELGWRFADVDEELIRAHTLAVSDLFEQAGEIGFRALEEQALAGLLQFEQCVIALGGGALESEKTRNRLLHSPGTYLVFLETPLDVALARCAKQSNGVVRPILLTMSYDDLKERYRRRLEHYSQSHCTLQTADRTPGDLVSLLAGLIARE